MEKLISIQDNATDYLDSLIQVLFKNEYFGFEESAQKYVAKMYDFIEFELVNSLTKSIPKKLTHLSSKYVFYKANNRTTWYVFFENKGNQYLVTHITNNHTEEAGFL